MMKRVLSAILVILVIAGIIPTPFFATDVNSAINPVIFNGHSYLYIADKTNWHDAKKYCESLGGHLVTITSAEENAFVASISPETVMIGLTDEESEGDWKWVTGEPYNYSNFASGEPNNERDEDYVLLHPNSQDWNDGHLNRENWPFVCEWDSQDANPKSTTGYFSKEITFAGHRYAISNVVTKWSDAKDICDNLGGHLVTITNEAEQEAVSQLVDSAHTLEAYWMGAYRDDQWIWVTGEGFNYANWHRGEPNGDKHDFYLQMFAGSRYEHGKWDDTWNNGDHGGGIKQQGFICEWENSSAFSSEAQYFLKLYVTSPSLSLVNAIGDLVSLNAELYKNNQLVSNWNKMTYSIEDNSVVSVMGDEYNNSNGHYLRLRGEKAGSTQVTISDVESGASVSVNLRFEEYNSLKSVYYHHTVPHLDVEGIGLDAFGEYRTNFYNLNGLFVCNYHLNALGALDQNNAHDEVSFDVYNSRYMHGAVDVYDANGNWIKSVKIEKHSSISGIWDTFESAAYMVADAIDGTLLTYVADSFATKTSVNISIPDGGYFTISNNFAESPGTLLYNVSDIMVLWLSGIAGMFFDGDTVGRGIETNYIDMIMNQDPVSRKILLDELRDMALETLGPLSQKIAGDILSAGDAMSATLAEFDDVMQSAGLSSAYDVVKTVAGFGEGYFEVLAGPPGAVLSLLFSANELQDYMLQAIQIANSIKKPYVAVQTLLDGIQGNEVKKYVGDFTDVTEDSWCAEYVRWALENGITKGTTATTFSPNTVCTTSQIITFLWRAAGSPEPKTTSNPFSDVNSGSYYYKAALWAYDNGLITSSIFNGGVQCTRASTVMFLWKLAGSPEHPYSAFRDVSNSAPYAKAVAWAVANGITNGTSSDTFSPDKFCTRGHIVAFLYRYSLLNIHPSRDTLYKQVLLDSSWNNRGLLGEKFAVFDINNDGTLEVAVECSAGRDDNVGAILYESDDGLNISDYGGIVTLYAVSPSKSRLLMGRTRGKNILTVLQYEVATGFEELGSWFFPYLDEAEAREIESQYFTGFYRPVFVDLNEINIDKYLSGAGMQTGYSGVYQ